MIPLVRVALLAFLTTLWGRAAYSQHASAVLNEGAEKSANNPYLFEHYSQEKGLSQGTFYGIAQYDDYLWFATQDGLNRFDGYAFKTYRAGRRQSLNTAYVQSVLADAKGRFWIGTTKGINLYRKSDETFERFNEVFRTQSPLDTLPIREMCEDRQGRVWVIADKQGLYRFNPATRQSKLFFATKANVANLITDTVGNVWVLTTDGLYVCRAGHDQFESFQFHQRCHLPAHVALHTLVADSQQRLWIGTYENGIYVIDPAVSAENPLTHHPEIVD